MGKDWDSHKGGRDKWIAWLRDILAECRRAMKPGAYGWVWALPRTAHWTATACEDAGFAVRDVLVHVFGTGFPKSRSLLKPASEHWILIKAPGDLRELRIEENRIKGAPRLTGTKNQTVGGGQHGILNKLNSTTNQAEYDANPPSGRWPANFALSHYDDCKPSGTRKVKTSDPRRADGTVNADLGSQGIYGGGNTPQGLDKPRYCDADGTETVEAWQCVDGCPVKALDEQSGTLKSGSMGIVTRKRPASGILGTMPAQTKNEVVGDSGTASRFFYVAKPSTRERSAGLPEGTRNTHVTVKATALMQHLISLIAAPGDLVLDPFAGSGTTGIAAVKQGCRFVGIEHEAEHVEIARQRIAFAVQSV
jgi:site-specific DNA-methyltransferase (adenine-specific)